MASVALAWPLLLLGGVVAGTLYLLLVYPMKFGAVIEEKRAARKAMEEKLESMEQL